MSALLTFLALFFLALMFAVEGKPTLEDLGTILRTNDPLLLARLEQIMSNDFANDGRLFNLQRLG